MVKLHIYWSDDDYNPSVITATSKDAWMLWWALIGNPTLNIPVSKPYAKKVELYDLYLGTKIDPLKGSRFSLGSTYNR